MQRSWLVVAALVSAPLVLRAEPRPRPSAAVRSVPRADWPCSVDFVAVDKVTWTYEYTGPSQCLLPIELVADGIVGCPTGITLSFAPSVGAAPEHRGLRYDDAGHLVAYQETPSMHRTYRWDGDTLLGEDDEGYKVDRGVTKLFEGKPMIQMSLDRAGRVTGIDYIESYGQARGATGRASVSWRATRLMSIVTRSLVMTSVTTMTPTYDCRPAAKEPDRAVRQ